MDFNFDNAVRAAELFGFFGGVGFYGWLSNRVTQRLNGKDLEGIEGVLGTVADATSSISYATAEVTEALADDVIDEAEAQAFLKTAGKVARYVKEKALAD